MLVLARKKNETIVVNGPCVITVTEIRGSCVKLGITADKEHGIRRGEIDEIDPTKRPIVKGKD